MATAKLSVKPTAPEQVEQWLKPLDRGLRALVQRTREVVLSASPAIGEEIKWNAPSFFFTGEMVEQDPKLYARYLLNFNVYRADCLRLILLRAGGLDDPQGILEGDYADGRRLVLLHGMDELQQKAAALRAVLRQQVANIGKVGRPARRPKAAPARRKAVTRPVAGRKKAGRSRPRR